MKVTNKKYMFSYLFLIVVMMFLSVLPIQAAAAEYEGVNVYFSGFSYASVDNKKQVGKSYFWGEINDDGKIMVYTSKSSKTKKGTLIAEINKPSSAYFYDVWTNGSYMYYVDYNKSNTKWMIRGVNVKGKNKKTLATGSGSAFIRKIYGNYIYFDKGKSKNSLCSLSVKTKKVKVLAKNYNDGLVSRFGSRYIYAVIETSKKVTVKVLDCKKSSCVKTSGFKKAEYDHLESILTKKYYYIFLNGEDYAGDYGKLYRCPISGSSGMKLFVTLKDCKIGAVDDNYVYYTKYDGWTEKTTYYRMKLKNKSVKKISQSTYEKAYHKFSLQ